MEVQFELESIKDMIYIIRGQKGMLDSDLAKLYGGYTKTLNRQVKRNESRFPKDFMFQLTEDEFESLRYQIGTSKEGRWGKKVSTSCFYREWCRDAIWSTQ
jgi:hypothetical protein